MAKNTVETRQPVCRDSNSLCGPFLHISGKQNPRNGRPLPLSSLRKYIWGAGTNTARWDYPWPISNEELVWPMFSDYGSGPMLSRPEAWWGGGGGGGLSPHVSFPEPLYIILYTSIICISPVHLPEYSFSLSIFVSNMRFKAEAVLNMDDYTLRQLIPFFPQNSWGLYSMQLDCTFLFRFPERREVQQQSVLSLYPCLVK